MMADRIHINCDGLEFHEHPSNGTRKQVLRVPESLTADQYLNLPDASGTLATQGYVGNITGGTFVGLASDFTNTDATSTPADVTGMSFTVEANRVYWVEGALIYFDDAQYGTVRATFSVPSGTTYRLYVNAMDDSTLNSNFGLWTDAAVRTQLYLGNIWMSFTGVFYTGGTAGTVNLQLVNASGDGTEQGFRKGSFIRVIDPQA